MSDKLFGYSVTECDFGFQYAPIVATDWSEWVEIAGPTYVQYAGHNYAIPQGYRYIRFVYGAKVQGSESKDGPWIDLEIA